MEKDFERFGVSGHDDKLGLAAVECLGRFVGAFLYLFVVGGLLDEVKYFDGQFGIGHWNCFGVGFLLYGGTEC